MQIIIQLHMLHHEIPWHSSLYVLWEKELETGFAGKYLWNANTDPLKTRKNSQERLKRKVDEWM